MKEIIAKFNSVCSGSGLPIKKGETIVYDPHTRKAYKLGKQPEINQDALHIQANEDAYFDLWYSKNY